MDNRALRFRSEFFEGWACARGLATRRDQAAFLGLSPSQYGRIMDGQTKPGETAIAAVLSAFARERDSGVRFEQLFELVDPSEAVTE